MSMTMAQTLYVDFDMGDAHQIIPMTLKTQQHPTYIVSEDKIDEFEVQVKYNENKSVTTFHKIYDLLITGLAKYDFTKGYYVNDTVKFNSSLIYNNFTYMLAKEVGVSGKNISGEIGFSNKKDGDAYLFSERTNFLQQLKDNDLIKNKIFGIVYDTEYEGRLFLGSYLYQVDQWYTEEDMKTNYIEGASDENRDKWLINFGVQCLQQSNNTEIYTEKNTYGLIMYEIGLIVGSSIFRDKFVKNYFEEKKCEESLISANPFGFYQYSCDSEEQFSDFPNIRLYLEGSYEFYFTKNDLFKKIGNKFIFQIVFEVFEWEISYWRLGQAFFRKYNSFFEMADQNQMFSYYPKKKERPESPSETPVKLIIIIVLSVVVCILVGIILVYLLKCRKEKKKRANELNDDYEYNAVNTPSESATG